MRGAWRSSAWPVLARQANYHAGVHAGGMLVDAQVQPRLLIGRQGERKAQGAGQKGPVDSR